MKAELPARGKTLSGFSRKCFLVFLVLCLATSFNAIWTVFQSTRERNFCAQIGEHFGGAVCITTKNCLGVSL